MAPPAPAGAPRRDLRGPGKGEASRLLVTSAARQPDSQLVSAAAVALADGDADLAKMRAEMVSAFCSASPRLPGVGELHSEQGGPGELQPHARVPTAALVTGGARDFQ